MGNRSDRLRPQPYLYRPSNIPRLNACRFNDGIWWNGSCADGPIFKASVDIRTVAVRTLFSSSIPRPVGDKSRPFAELATEVPLQAETAELAGDDSVASNEVR